MARFVFELETVLQQRVREEEKRQRAVAVIERERLAIEEEIEACRAQIDEEKRDLASRLDEQAALDRKSVG